MTADLEKGRDHYGRREWADAFESLKRAQDNAPLDLPDLDRLVWSAGLIGDDAEFLRALEHLHETCCENGDMRQAARSAFWIGFRHFSTGSTSQAMGWLARAERQLDKVGDECAEHGYLLLPTVYRHLFADENEAAEAIARDVTEIAERCGDPDLAAIARNLRGRALLRLRHVQAGLALIDDAMISVTSGKVAPLVAGIVYCNVIASCNQVYALDRAREWTATLTHWIEQQPQLVNFTGTCLVHRSEIMQLAGEWGAALEEARLVCNGVCNDKDPEVYADACYQQAELLRLQGLFEDAETAYRLANRNGRDPQPGLALLRLAEGHVNEAVAAIERVVSTTKEQWKRARVLPAFFEIMYAANKLDRARQASDELLSIADEFGTEILGAIADQTRGAIALADGNAEKAVEFLQRAFAIWNRVGAPYITARIRVLLANAYRILGDNDGADMEIDAARATFETLGAKPDLEALPVSTRQAAQCGLSPRELGVLKLLARGETNKAIAAELGLSERTIHRHVSNIFNKFDVATRAAATAVAYQKKLI